GAVPPAAPAARVDLHPDRVSPHVPLPSPIAHLSLHDALPIYAPAGAVGAVVGDDRWPVPAEARIARGQGAADDARARIDRQARRQPDGAVRHRPAAAGTDAD